VSDHEQGSLAWYEARAGHVTASRIKDVMAKPRKGQKESAARKAYMAQLICERLIGKSLEEERSNFYDIKRGKDLESVARVEYEMSRGVVVDTAGFAKHPTLAMAGCSPDGLIGKEGLCQLKAPRRHIHIDWIMAGVVPSDHKDQMLFELACHPERQWNDFVSYVEELPPHLQLFIVRQPRDEVKIAEIEAAVAKFNAEIEETIAKLPTGEGDNPLHRRLQESLETVRNAKGQIVPIPF
jgi:hypothetical protein